MASSNIQGRNFAVVLFIVASLVIDGLAARLDPTTILTQRVTNLERTMTSIRQMTNIMTRRITNLETLNRAQAQTISTLAVESSAQMSDISDANAELRQKNTELQTMLGTFERFFGSLLVESPDSFDHTRNALQRMDTLNSFLGNRQAFLVELRADPETVPDNTTLDTEALGRALTELSEVNTDLKQKVTKLERRVDNGALVAGDRSLTGGTDDIFTLNQCSDRLISLEAQVNALTSTQLEKDSASRAAGSKDVISDRDRDILEGAVYGARAATSARKSAFSVASTSSVIGTTNAKHIGFDYVYANKGNHWNASSDTYEVGINGYYYFTFTLRSYDGYYMGVSLMKNDDYVTAVYTESSNRNVMEGQSVVLPLRVGDRIWLRLGPSTLFGLHSDSFKYCTFSGFLIYKGI